MRRPAPLPDGLGSLLKPHPIDICHAEGPSVIGKLAAEGAPESGGGAGDKRAALGIRVGKAHGGRKSVSR
jgi:hypothetical protein